MYRFTSMLFLAALSLLVGCPTSKVPSATNSPDVGDAAVADRVLGDIPQDTDPVDTSVEDTAPPLDIPVQDTAPPPDTNPEDITQADLPGPCEGLDCLPTCSSDADCPPGNICVPHHDDCCSDCVPFCEICYMAGGGTWCAETPPDDLCEVGTITATEVGLCWFDVTYTGEDGTDVLFMDGCMDHAENLPINQCGLTYEDMTNSFEVACNWCGPVKYTKAACGEAMVELTPLCVHAPHLVAAGGPFPVAIYGQTGCASFDHAEVVQDGFDVQVTLWGLADSDPCDEYDACGPKSWVYTGLVWAEAPNPGAYTVTVAGAVTQIVGASGGIIAEPDCQDDCAGPELETYDWTLEALTGEPVTGDCFTPPGDPGTALNFEGACQDYVVSAEGWGVPAQVLHCNDGEVYFGDGAPYIIDARTCDPDPLGWVGETLMLGISQDWSDPSGGTALFLLRGLMKQ